MISTTKNDDACSKYMKILNSEIYDVGEMWTY